MYLIALVDSNSGWPNALFQLNITSDNVIEILKENIEANGIPKRIRTGSTRF